MAKRGWNLDDLPPNMRAQAETQMKQNGGKAGRAETEVIGAATEEKKPNKYNAVKTEYDGRMYDSKKEARRAVELDFLIQKGEVIYYLAQVPIRFRSGITYWVDFQVFWATGEVGYEDVKGMQTPVFKAKMKLLAHEYPAIYERLVLI